MLGYYGLIWTCDFGYVALLVVVLVLSFAGGYWFVG